MCDVADDRVVGRCLQHETVRVFAPLPERHVAVGNFLTVDKKGVAFSTMGFFETDRTGQAPVSSSQTKTIRSRPSNIPASPTITSFPAAAKIVFGMDNWPVEKSFQAMSDEIRSSASVKCGMLKSKE